MKIDKFTIFACYKPEEQDLLNKYVSPDVECSSFKGVPMKLYGQFMKMLPKKSRRIRFRGTSKTFYRRPRDFVHKQYADTFAVYYD